MTTRTSRARLSARRIRPAPPLKAPGLARNLETKLQGSGIVGNNLADALSKARSDSLYARIVFLFLGFLRERFSQAW